MIACSIIGFKDSGKTTLTSALADALEALGKSVAIAKFTHHGLDKEGTDTASFAKTGRTIIGLGENEAVIHWHDNKYLIDMLPLINADVLLVEGGKSLTWLPRVLVLRSASEAEELDKGLALATYGDVAAPYLKSYRTDEVQKLAELIVERGFMLPGLDCGACAEDDCMGIAQRIVKGEATVKDCESNNKNGFSITVNGSPIGMNPFVGRIISSSIKGMLGELKGYAPGEIVITINE